MGYISTYSMDINYSSEYANARPDAMGPSEEEKIGIIKAFRDQYEDAMYALDEDGDCNDGAKWYDHAEDLRDFSKQYPNHLLCLQCQGEEGEQWEVFAVNGKYKRIEPEVIWPVFDESQLE